MFLFLTKNLHVPQLAVHSFSMHRMLTLFSIFGADCSFLFISLYIEIYTVELQRRQVSEKMKEGRRRKENHMISLHTFFSLM